MTKVLLHDTSTDVMAASTQLNRIKQFNFALSGRFKKSGQYSGMEQIWNEV